MGRRVAQLDIHERRAKCERPLLQVLAQPRRISREKSVRAKFCAAVSGLRHFIQNASVRVVCRIVDVLHDAPADWRIRYAYSHPFAFRIKRAGICLEDNSFRSTRRNKAGQSGSSRLLPDGARYINAPVATLGGGKPLEHELQAKLNLSLGVRHGLGDGCASRYVHISSTAASSTRPEVWKAKIGMVEDVEEFRPETEIKFLAQLKRLVKREIEIHIIRAAQHGAFGVSEHVSIRLKDALIGSESRKSESRLIEPAKQGLVTGTVAA